MAGFSTTTGRLCRESSASSALATCRPSIRGRDDSWPALYLPLFSQTVTKERLCLFPFLIQLIALSDSFSPHGCSSTYAPFNMLAMPAFHIIFYHLKSYRERSNVPLFFLDRASIHIYINILLGTVFAPLSPLHPLCLRGNKDVECK